MGFDAIGAVLSNAWSFLAGITVPGFSFSFAVVLIGAFFVTIVFKVGQIILGIFAGTTGRAVRSSYRAGRANNARISKERQGDVK